MKASALVHQVLVPSLVCHVRAAKDARSSQGIDVYGFVNREDVPEYAKLVARQLGSNQVVSSDQAAAGGKVFAVGKPTGAQRQVWHGTRVSETAARPKNNTSASVAYRAFVAGDATWWPGPPV